MFSKHNSQELSNFTAVSKANSNAVKKNAVYYFISTQALKQDPLVKPFQLLKPQNQITTNETKAYLFRFQTNPVTELFAELGFKYTERHLRVDQLYSLPTSEKGNCGFAAAHYTENYIHNNGAKLTVHVFFTEEGNYLQIKTLENNATVTYKEKADITPYLVNNIHKNAHEAITLYSDLNHGRAQQWLDKSQQADTLESKLSTLSVKIQSKQEQINYIKLAKELIELIKEANNLDEFKIDARTDRIQDRINYIEESMHAAPKKEDNTPESSSSSSSSSKPTTQITVFKKAATPNKQEIYKTELFNALNEMSIQLNAAETANELADFIRIATKIRQLITETYFLKKVTDEEVKLVKSLESKISSLSAPEDFALKQFKAGKLKEFTTIFPILATMQQVTLITNMLEALLIFNSDNNEVARSQIAICDHLFKTSSVYRVVIIMENYALRFCHGHNWSASILVWLCTYNRHAAFEMLLNHGVTPNRTGFLHENVSFSILRFLMALPDTGAFIKTLLNHGALVDGFDTVLTEQSLKLAQNLISKDSKKYLTPSLTIDKALSESFLNGDFLHNSSDLLVACAYANFEAIPLLLEQSSLANIAIGLSYLTNHVDMNTRFISNYCLEHILYKSKQEADSTLCTVKPYSFHISFYPHSTGSLVSKRVTAIEHMLRTFDKKFIDSDDEIKKLIKTLEQINADKNKENSDMVYLACKFVICKRGVLDKDWAEKLIQCLCHIGTNLLKHNQKSLAQTNFNRACETAVAFGLEETGVYKFAKRKLATITAPESFFNGAASSSSSSSTANQSGTVYSSKK